MNHCEETGRVCPYRFTHTTSLGLKQWCASNTTCKRFLCSVDLMLVVCTTMMTECCLLLIRYFRHIKLAAFRVVIQQATSKKAYIFLQLLFSGKCLDKISKDENRECKMRMAKVHVHGWTKFCQANSIPSVASDFVDNWLTLVVKGPLLHELDLESLHNWCYSFDLLRMQPSELTTCHGQTATERV